MTSASNRLWAPLLNWYLHRNPTYVLSAAAMAVGGKLYLDAPDLPAGQIGHILLTLGLLELYEATVAGILIGLHRSRRSPEDLPALMLVAALFWTGPLAATLELTARSATLGHVLAAAAWLIAIVEFWGVSRAIRLQTSPAGRMVCVLSLILIAAMPGVLRVPYGEAGTSELALYGAWWLLGLLGLFAVPAMRWHFVPPGRCQQHAANTELALLVVVLVATGTHLYGMNYVFFGNARSFYAAPLLAAFSALMFEVLAVLGIANRRWLVLAALLPFASMVGACGGFSSSVPTQALPPPARDALVAALLLAGGSWWYGAARHRSVPLLHMGAAAVALAAVRAWRSAVLVHDVVTPAAGPLPVWVAATGFAMVAYLLLIALLLRSRSHVVVALAAQFGSVAALVTDRWECDQLVTLVLGAWTWLAILHVAGRPGWTAQLAPLTLLVVVACYYDADFELRWAARGQMAATIALLAGIGLAWPLTRYRVLAATAGGAWGAFLLSRHCYTGPGGPAAAVVTAAFTLLVIAAAISWYKPKLIATTSPFRSVTNADARREDADQRDSSG